MVWPLLPYEREVDCGGKPFTSPFWRRRCFYGPEGKPENIEIVIDHRGITSRSRWTALKRPRPGRAGRGIWKQPDPKMVTAILTFLGAVLGVVKEVIAAIRK